MVKSWWMALAAVLVAVPPAWAQTAPEKSEVKVQVQSGGVVVKKIVRNGNVVEENVEVFGDLDDETRERIMALLKTGKLGAKKGQKKALAAGKKGPKLQKKNKKASCSCGGSCVITTDDAGRVFSIGPGMTFKLDTRVMPSGKIEQDQLKKAWKCLGGSGGAAGFSIMIPDSKALEKTIQKEVHKALEKLHHEHGIDLKGLDRKLLKSLEIEKLGKQPHVFHAVPGTGGVYTRFGQAGPKSHVSGKTRIRVEVDGREVLNKEIETGRPQVMAYKYVPGKSIQGKVVPGKIITGMVIPGKSGKTFAPSPQTRMKILRKKKADQEPSSTQATIERLERTIERLQRDLEKLKKELGGVHPPRPQSARARRI